MKKRISEKQLILISLSEQKKLPKKKELCGEDQELMLVGGEFYTGQS